MAVNTSPCPGAKFLPLMGPGREVQPQEDPVVRVPWLGSSLPFPG